MAIVSWGGLGCNSTMKAYSLVYLILAKSKHFFNQAGCYKHIFQKVVLKVLARSLSAFSFMLMPNNATPWQRSMKYFPTYRYFLSHAVVRLVSVMGAARVSNQRFTAIDFARLDIG